MSSSSSVALIKGYLPVRVKIPTADGSDETFFFVKEHRATTTTPGEESASKKQKKGATLFVANAPVVPLIRTKLLLKSLMGRFGEISRVTVIPNPRVNHIDDEAQDDDQEKVSLWTTEFEAPSFLPPSTSEGKFAHVVFDSHKDMRRTMRALTQVMSETTTADSDDDNDDPVSRLPGLSLEKIEIQTLADESDRQYREENSLQDDDDDDFAEESKQQTRATTGVLAVAEQYRTSLRLLSREALLEECNTVIEEFENAEEEGNEARAAATKKPDDDGFVTVSYTSQVGSRRELEDTSSGQRRRKGQKRNRKKKENVGLEDFYRFQTKEKRKQSLQDLRRQFEDDLEKVKKMKEDRKYRPF